MVTKRSHILKQTCRLIPSKLLSIYYEISNRKYHGHETIYANIHEKSNSKIKGFNEKQYDTQALEKDIICWN